MNRKSISGSTMVADDEWGRDPQIRYMRRVFAHMEEAQKKLLNHLHVAPFDDRLRRWRDIARTLFEKTWPVAMRKDIVTDEKDAATLYVYCLAHAISLRGTDVPAEALPVNQKIRQFLKETLK